MKKKLITSLLGFCGGFVNGFFGTGGGMILVPLMEKFITVNNSKNKNNKSSDNNQKMDPKKAHATCVMVIFFLSAVSIIFYYFGNSVNLNDVKFYILGGIIGAPFGAFFLKKISNVWLKRGFGAFLIFAAVKMLFNI